MNCSSALPRNSRSNTSPASIAAGSRVATASETQPSGARVSGAATPITTHAATATAYVVASTSVGAIARRATVVAALKRRAAYSATPSVEITHPTRTAARATVASALGGVPANNSLRGHCGSHLASGASNDGWREVSAMKTQATATAADPATNSKIAL